MIKRLLLMLVVFSLIVPVAEAKSIGGINLPATFNADGTNLILNGAGVRTKLFMDIYVAALYLKSKSSDHNKIMNADEPMAVRLHIVSRLIGKDTFIEKTTEGFKRSAGSSYSKYKDEIQLFFRVFGDGISKNNKYDLVYIPGKGTKIYKNGAYKLTVKGLDFKKVLFGIWLKPNCPLTKLRQGMLGK